MNLDAVITLLVGGAFTVAIISILFAPNSPLGSTIGAFGKSLGNLTIAAKSTPGGQGYQS